MNIKYCIFAISIFISCSDLKKHDESQNSFDFLVSESTQKEIKHTFNYIQDSIDYALGKAILTEDTSLFYRLENRLIKIKSDKDKNVVRIANYWESYLFYHKAMYYYLKDNKRESKGSIDEGIQLLNELNNKSAEEYTLLALLQYFSLQFKPGPMAGISSRVAKSNLDKSIELDSQNIRSLYVRALNDYYTPRKFGGGKQVEKYLHKLFEVDVDERNSYKPHWGKRSAYELMIQFYLDNNSVELAEKYYQLAKIEYPNDYVIAQFDKIMNK